eukprot:1154472-Pelagomonas_calceolata.AAC.11
MARCVWLRQCIMHKHVCTHANIKNNLSDGNAFNATNVETGMHPLSMAASLGDVELTGMMLENKAHVDAVVSGYHVPNFWAVGFAFGKRKKFDVAMSDHPAPDVLCCLAK